MESASARISYWMSAFALTLTCPAARHHGAAYFSSKQMQHVCNETLQPVRYWRWRWRWIAAAAAIAVMRQFAVEDITTRHRLVALLT
jgi:hypothetical protein